MSSGAAWVAGMKALQGNSQEVRSSRIREDRKSPAMKCADLRRRVGAIFGQDAINCVEIHPFQVSSGASIDPFKLEEFLAKKHPDFPKEDEANPDAECDSIKEFIAKKYSPEIADWVEASI